jgi:hypothetical protein
MTSAMLAPSMPRSRSIFDAAWTTRDLLSAAASRETRMAISPVNDVISDNIDFI